MKAFFKVTDLETMVSLKAGFEPVESETISLNEALGRILAADLKADQDLPGFDRSTMDGYAVAASSTFGASEANPAYLNITGAVQMGKTPESRIGPGQAARIATGGMLPEGADSVVMVEHTDAIDEDTIEVYCSVVPGQHTVARDEDAAAGQTLLTSGTCLRPQEIGILAACGQTRVNVFCKPKVGIISSGDEIIPISSRPAPGQVRDINGHTLSALVLQSGGRPAHYGVAADSFQALESVCRKALSENDMVIISGGSSVGARDLTLDVLKKIPQSHILVHGVSIRPGKPTILARCENKAFWGLPGHVTSAMIVFLIVVRPFLEKIAGRPESKSVTVHARLSRNIASAQGRVDYVRVRLVEKQNTLWAEPVLGASGLIRTMVAADGLIAVDLNSEGLDQGAMVKVQLL
ncbi:MAG: molybdopterin molybdotransferase MoeA [Desulfobacteraceae bacterium]|nr:molybdopterin molybdotransferase MoeA [Desulfobacteraceae bacterium]